MYNKHMDIKKLLKNMNIKLYEFSEKLNISRPTLNSYISEFEIHKKVSNKKINDIFIKLFNKDIEKEVFLKLLDEFYLENKGDDENNYSEENQDLIHSINERMKNDLKGPNSNNALYKFINSALYMYGNDPALTGYINYNLYLNGLKDLKKIKGKEKKLVSNLFPIMKKYVTSSLIFSEEGYLDFIKRIKEIEDYRNKKREEIENEIKEKLSLEIKNQIKQGINIEDISIEEILKKIKT